MGEHRSIRTVSRHAPANGPASERAIRSRIPTRRNPARSYRVSLAGLADVADAATQPSTAPVVSSTATNRCAASLPASNASAFGESEDGALGDHIVAANAVRPLVEGYLHRRFPGHVPEGPLGAVIVEINQSTAPDVLLHANPLVPELSEINDWAAGLHHDTQSD